MSINDAVLKENSVSVVHQKVGRKGLSFSIRDVAARLRLSGSFQRQITENLSVVGLCARCVGRIQVVVATPRSEALQWRKEGNGGLTGHYDLECVRRAGRRDGAVSISSCFGTRSRTVQRVRKPLWEPGALLL